jgi:hypothetical protein
MGGICEPVFLSWPVDDSIEIDGPESAQVFVFSIKQKEYIIS